MVELVDTPVLEAGALCMGVRVPLPAPNPKGAEIAQLVEHSFCKRAVVNSTLTFSTRRRDGNDGGVAADCKSAPKG